MDIEPSFRIEKGHRITYYNCVVLFKPLICFFLRLMSRFVLGKGGERVKRGRFTYRVLHVWINGATGWQLVARQATLLAK